jgi:hypothetical protein
VARPEKEGLQGSVPRVNSCYRLRESLLD